MLINKSYIVGFVKWVNIPPSGFECVNQWVIFVNFVKWVNIPPGGFECLD